MNSEQLETPDYIKGRIVDMHAHFFPQKLFASIWKWFYDHHWHIAYQDSPEGLARTLRGLGVREFVTYNYAHKHGMAEGLNMWTAEFARGEEGALPFATVMPGDDGNLEMLEMLFDDHGFLGIKLQPLVSDFYLCDDRMMDVYRFLLERGKILTVHAGTAPVANRYVGADYFEPVLRELPDLKVIVAHMGAFEFDRFFAMVRRYPNVYLDTSVNFIDSELIAGLVSEGRFPPLEVPAGFDPDVLVELSDRLLFGSDFPNIPYAYEDCIDSILALGLGEEFNRKVFFENAERLIASAR
ncbi:MAG: amidohydrolase family protein [Candidatus Geothermincolia bacterium]